MKEFAEQYEKQQQLLSPHEMYDEVTEDIFGDPEKNEVVTDIQITYETIRLPQMRVTCTKGPTHTKIDISTMGNVPVSSFIVRNDSLQRGEQVHIFPYQGVNYQFFIAYNTGTNRYEARFVEPLELLVTPSGFSDDMTYDAATKKLSYVDGAGVYQILALKHTYATKPYELGVRTDAEGIQRTGMLSLEANMVRVRYTRIEKPIDLSTLPPGRLVELRGTDKLQPYGIRASVREGVVRFADARGNLLLQIDEADYAETMKKIKAIYTHDELCVVDGKSYQIKLTSLGSGKAIVELKLFAGGFTSFVEEVKCVDVDGNDKPSVYTTKYYPNQPDRLQSSVDIFAQGNKKVATIRFRDLSGEQQRALGNPNLGNCSFPLVIDGSWKLVYLANADREGGVALQDLDTGLYNNQLHVRSGAGTTGSWVANVTLDSAHQIDYVRVQQSGRTYSALLDSAFIDSLRKYGSTATKVRETADGGKYSLVCKNVNGNLQVTVVTTIAPTKPDLVEEARRNKDPITPITTPRDEHDHAEHEPSENDPIVTDHEYEDDHSDEEPQVISGPNPWGGTETESLNMIIGGEVITGFYTKPRLLPGSGPLNLEDLYIDKSGGSFSFRLMEDERGFDDKLLDINIAGMNIGDIVTISGPDNKSRKVRLEVYDKKLGFALAAPRSSTDGSIETVEGVPVLYNPCYPAGVRMAGIKMTQEDGTPIRGTTGTSRTRHGGLDIAGTYSSKILAATDGEVVYVKSSERNNSAGDFKGNRANKDARSFGNTVVIMHPGGYFTAYHHLSPTGITVRPGDKVVAGQHIANMGNSGTVWSSRKNGTHLHLSYYKLDETYVQQALDAGHYASLREDISRTRSNVSKSKFLWLDPEKYLVDDAPRTPNTPKRTPISPSPPPPESTPRRGSFERSGHPKGRNFPSEVSGNTSQERLDNFLTYMGYDKHMLNRIADSHGLDRAIMPAIIWAEYGKGMPRKNNPGNVMIPRTSTLKTYSSIEEGLVGMAETLNNTSLSSYMVLGELNGYARSIAGLPPCKGTNGIYCYATDVTPNRYTNVTNFMSFVYNTKVDYTYKFRRRATAPEAGGGEFLTRQPKARIAAQFSYNNIAFASYLPQLAPPVGQDRRNAPRGWLVTVESGRVYLMTPGGKQALTSGTITVGGTVYTVSVKKNSTERLFPNAAQFTLTKQ